MVLLQSTYPREYSRTLSNGIPFCDSPYGCDERLWREGRAAPVYNARLCVALPRSRSHRRLYVCLAAQRESSRDEPNTSMSARCRVSFFLPTLNGTRSDKRRCISGRYL